MYITCTKNISIAASSISLTPPPMGKINSLIWALGDLGIQHGTFFYHLQTEFAKVMFLQVSVILFTEGGWWWWYPTMHCRSSGPHPRGKLKGLAWGVLHSGGRGGSPGPHLEGSLHAVSQHALRQTAPLPPADGYCCGQYAS